jgi:cysteinyl-tRNA synthetase
MASLPSLYNTLTRRAEPLSPRDPGRVTLYCCGPTVYDVPHVGHARAALAPDVLVRHLRRNGLEVVYARNITDVEDKILDRAKKNGESPLELADRMTRVYRDQMRAIGCVPPDHEPKVTEHIPQIVELVERLIAAGNAYPVDRPNGTRDVYYSVRSFAGYGKLSRRRIDELQSGARVETDELKQDPLDFALWKGATSEEWGWESPLGRGRPGWHIECSAMSTHYLGHGFDVHAGGMDLIFPHHENEIAQSEAACDQGPMARVWMHNGFVNVDKEKMSKSLGNFVTITDVLARNDPEAFRWFLLGVHYRGPIQFDTEQLSNGRVVFPGVDEAERRVDYLYETLGRLRELASHAGDSDKIPPELKAARVASDKALEQAHQALDDDLNTPVALAALGELARLGNELADLAQRRRKDAAFSAAAANEAEQLLAAIADVAGRCGMLETPAELYAERTRARRLTLRGLSEAFVTSKVEERRAARANKEFARADALRDELVESGIRLFDHPGGTDWTVEP